MSLQVKEDFLQLDYNQDDAIYDEASFFDEENSQPFDKHSAKQMLLMMNRVSENLQLDDYAMKKLEIVLRDELPFFAVNRRLVLKWINENFLF